LRILLAGDLHGQLDSASQVIEAATEENIDLIIQLGDFGFIWKDDDLSKFNKLNDMLTESKKTMFFLDGNHENFDLLNRLGANTENLTITQLQSRVYYLPRGYRFNIDGVKFMSFGGATSVDQDSRVHFISWFPQEAITDVQVRKVTEEPVDILLTHDCPELTGTLRTYLNQTEFTWPDRLIRSSWGNRMRLYEIYDKVKPKILVHGHYHYCYKDKLQYGDLYRYKDEIQYGDVYGLGCDGVPNSMAILDTKDLSIKGQWA